MERLAQEAANSEPIVRTPIEYRQTMEIGEKQLEVEIHEATPFREVPEKAYQSILATINDHLPKDMRFLTANIARSRDRKGLGYQEGIAEETLDQEVYIRPRSQRAERARLHGQAALLRENLAPIRAKQDLLNQQITEVERQVVLAVHNNQDTEELMGQLENLKQQKRQILEDNREALDYAKARLEEIHKEAVIKDKVTEQYLKGQQEITVSTEYGEVSAQSFHLIPPAEAITEESSQLPPIVLIGGWGADAAGVENMAIQLCAQGREVLFVGYPDSYGGEMTLKFAQATSQEGQDGLRPQAEFFIAAYSALLERYGYEGSVEVWGHSAGSMIGAEMLNVESWANRVENAMLVAPAGTAEISQVSQVIGYARNITRYLRDITNLPRDLAYHSYTSGRRADVNNKNPIRTKFHQALQKIVWNKGTLPHARTLQENTYEGVKPVKGKVYLIHGDEDYATGSAGSSHRYEPRNKTIETRTALGMNHADFIIDPKKVIEVIDKFMGHGPNLEQN